MKYLMLFALVGLAACTVTYENYSYEVTQRTPKEVRVQTHKGALGMAPEQVALAFRNMDLMATKECQGFGKKAARFTGDRTYTTGAYYAWVERIYSCT